MSETPVTDSVLTAIFDRDGRLDEGNAPKLLVDAIRREERAARLSDMAAKDNADWFNSLVHDLATIYGCPEKPSAVIEAAKLRKTAWGITCIHHTDKERENPTCPVCLKAESDQWREWVEKLKKELEVVLDAYTDSIRYYRTESEEDKYVRALGEAVRHAQQVAEGSEV